MKRWQNRGEVQDSDEEELSLESGSPSPKQARKRLKIGGGYGEIGAQKSLLSGEYEHNDAESQGSASKDAADAEEKARRVAKPADALSFEKTTLCETSHVADTTEGSEEAEDPAWTIQKAITTYGRRRRQIQRNQIRLREVEPVVRQAEQDGVALTSLSGKGDLNSRSNPPSQERSPLTSPGPTLKDHEIRPDSSIQEPNHVSGIFSRASSPLSDLSDPPESPLAPVSPRPIETSGSGQAAQPHVISGTEPLEAEDQAAMMFSLTQEPTRRSLRARQEKQLHPYMYDKALYQRQCRERGLKPVRLLEQALRETQEASLSHDDDRSRHKTQLSSSEQQSSSHQTNHQDHRSSQAILAGDSDRATSTRDPARSDDELPDINVIVFGGKEGLAQHVHKRRKLGHLVVKPQHTVPLGSKRSGTRGDVSTIPPSLPSTLDPDATPQNSQPPPRFKLLRGISPTHLPTPQVSSDTRQPPEIQEASQSEGSSPPRTTRRVRLGRPVSISEDPSSESEQPTEVEDDNLYRERKRIRGVLPASWLKIDRKAQRTRPSSSSSDGLQNTASPPPSTAPRKGVARKSTARSSQFPRPLRLDSSDDDGSDTSARPQSAARTRPSGLSDFHLQPGSVFGNEVDLDDMEADWVDPMLAGTSRGRKESTRGTKRQPRITEAFNHAQGHGLDFSEERNGLRRVHAFGPGQSERHRTQTRKSAPKRSRPPELSILDAPRSPAESAGKLPQFVRIAARQARNSTNHARHHPSSKDIRLATHGDTEDAIATLRKWRQGRIPQRDLPERNVTSAESGDSNQARAFDSRPPLVERNANPSKLSVGNTSRKAPTFDGADLTDYDLTASPWPARAGASRPSAAKDERFPPQPASRGKNGRPQQRLSNAVAVRYRNAQLESPAPGYQRQSKAASFRRRIECLTESVARADEAHAARALPMTRFLQEVSQPQAEPVKSPGAPRGHTGADPAQALSVTVQEQTSSTVPHRPRKSRPKRIDIEAREYRQPSEPLPVPEPSHIDEVDEPLAAETGLVLRGLGPFGTRYATDFDVRHLPRGTFFHECTFIGSGDLAASLALRHRNFNIGAGSIRVYINDKIHEWDVWTEEVSTAIGEISSSVSTAVAAVNALGAEERVAELPAVVLNVDHMLRSTVRYVSRCLHFYDPVDRSACVRRLCQFVDDILEVTDDSPLWLSDLKMLKQRVLRYTVTIARQAFTLCEDAPVSSNLRASTRECMLAAAGKLAVHVVPDNLQEMRQVYEDCRTAHRLESGIRDDNSAIAAIIVLSHTLRDLQAPRSLFWDVLNKALVADRVLTNSAVDFDRQWYDFFTILPSLDFDSDGMIKSHGDCQQSDWTLPRRLVDRCLELYSVSSAVRGSTINEYIRSVLVRCHRLVTTWRWPKCETMLTGVFDFYARRGLRLLNNEDGRGSPEFLNNLEQMKSVLTLEAKPGDVSFHLFLKVLASALSGLRHYNIYPEKKIGGIAWRFIPNHARVYRRDVEVQQSDLDALRNHCDLLCTLYFASPPQHRLRVDLLRNLVDHSSSHREACRISVRAWANLASYQASTSEPVSALEPFIEWFKEMVLTTVAQYRLARTEADQQYAEAKARGTAGVTNEVLERTVASNQRQIAATLVDLLASLKRAIAGSSTLHVAVFLFEKAEPWTAFNSFSPSERRLHNVFLESLDILASVPVAQKRLAFQAESQQSTEDSQDYGDFSILQEFGGTQGDFGTSSEVEAASVVQEPLGHLLSNAFGSEIAPDDAFLTRVVDLWVAQASCLVENDARSWSNFVDDYSSSAWYRLRETDHWRKFTPYFLARVVECGTDAYPQLKPTILAAWLTSLVERDSLLKYQQLLTTAILNARLDGPLLQNLPFSENALTGKFDCSLQELRQRRLGLISSLLANMRRIYDDAVYECPQFLPELRRTFSDLLRKLMQAMKSNYEELQATGDGSTVAESGIQGAYVDFVQGVVTFLQQYTTDIYPIDRFFTDSSAFPLPAEDPEYVVGRLRSYVPKLEDSKIRKQLAVFVHAVSERAAIDGKQAYLVQQFSTAMCGILERGNQGTPSLRHVLLSAVFPAYINQAVSDPCLWILAVPMLEASAGTCAQLLCDTDLDDADSVATALKQVNSVLRGIYEATTLALMHPGLFGLPHVQRVLATMVHLCRRSLVFVYHVKRSTRLADTTMAILRALRNQFNAVEHALSLSSNLFEAGPDSGVPRKPTPTWPDTSEFAAKQVRESMANDWYAVDGHYYVRRGNTSKQVAVGLGNEVEEKEGLTEALEEFRVSLARQHRSVRGRRGGGFAAIGGSFRTDLDLLVR